MEPKPYSVGVLYVHGMGEQEQGDSVTDMGDELTEWLRKWLAPVPKADFKIREARLRTGDQVLAGTPDHPIGGEAHVSITITDESKQPPAVQEWLLAESWWAKTFRQATFTELVAWAFSAGPWLIASQRAGLESRFNAAAQAGRDGPLMALGRRVIGVVLMIVAAVVAAAITPVFLALLVFSLIPIPGLQDVVKALAKNLSGSFGDLLVLVRSPVRFAAMAEQVRSDIDDLYVRCDRVIVLAHSQGSAVSWHAIRRTAERKAEIRSQVALFISFGQAFRKLKSLYRVHQSGGRERSIFLGLATLSTILLVLAAWQAAGVVGELIDTQFNLGAVMRNIGTNVLWFGAAVLVVLLIQEVLVRLARAERHRGRERGDPERDQGRCRRRCRGSAGWTCGHRPIRRPMGRSWPIRPRGRVVQDPQHRQHDPRPRDLLEQSHGLRQRGGLRRRELRAAEPDRARANGSRRRCATRPRSAGAA